MEKIRFLNDTTVYDGRLSLANNVVTIYFDSIIPPKSVLSNGFELLNENNGFIQGDYSRYNTIYRTFENNEFRVDFSCDGSIYLPPVPKITFSVGMGGSLTGDLTQEASNYNELQIPTPIPNENYVFSKWVPEIEESGIIDEDLRFQAIFEYVPPYEEILNRKISELSSTCENMIISGVTINNEHFSYGDKDQMNIKELFDTVSVTRLPIGYHADGKACREFSAFEVVNLYVQQVVNKYSNETYFNQARDYLNSLEKSDENKDYVSSYTYGTALTGEYLQNYNNIMALYQAQIDAILPENVNNPTT